MSVRNRPVSPPSGRRGPETGRGGPVGATWATMRGALTDAVARRAAFWSQVGAMIVNDSAWVVFWVIFFHRVGTVRGWDTHRVLLLFAMLTTSGGLVLGLFSNARRIPSLVGDGALDEVLSLPVSPLPHLLVKRIDTVNLGDVAFGITLFTLSAHPTPARVGIYLVGVAASAVLLTGFLVATGSLVFFSGRGQGGELGLHSILLLAAYPADVFSGATKALLYTAVPAAFVSGVPARLVDHFRGPDAAALLAASAFFGAIGWTVFSLGPRRYTSGSAWSRG